LYAYPSCAYDLSVPMIVSARMICVRMWNKHIPDGVSLNGERLIVVHIVIVDYLHSLGGGSLNSLRRQGTQSNR